MTGQPGRSGGYRIGAGRKPKPKMTTAAPVVQVQPTGPVNPVQYWQAVLDDPRNATTRRDRAAQLLMSVRMRQGGVGKRELEQLAVKEALQSPRWMGPDGTSDLAFNGGVTTREPDPEPQVPKPQPPTPHFPPTDWRGPDGRSDLEFDPSPTHYPPHHPDPRQYRPPPSDE